MPLPALNWRMLSPVTITISGPTMANLLDAIYTMGTASTYADGAARTPGAGSAWTWGRDTTNTNNPGVTTACFGTPPLNPGLGQKVLLAGSLNAATPTMCSGSGFTDTFAVNTLLLGLCKNAGAYNNANPAANLGWRDANPFTTGQFTGFVRGGLTFTSSFTLPVTVLMWESQEAIVVVYIGANANAGCVMAGALIDPLSSSANNAETDGRLYSIMTSGAFGTMTSTLWDPGTATGSPFYSGISNRQHCLILNLGATASVRNVTQPYTFSTTASSIYASGQRYLGTLSFNYSSPGTAYAGQGRQFYWTASSLAGQDLRFNNVSQGYTVSSSITSAVEAFVVTP